VVVGGEAAVGAQVVAQVEAQGTSTRRIAGATRYETSAEVYAEGLAEGMNETVVWLATGSNWPDALVVGPAAAAAGNGFLIIDGRSLSASPATREVLMDRADVIETARLVGGAGTISEQVEQEVRVILNP
jgi:large repetitive protein